MQVDDINVRDAAGLTPLHWAAKTGNVAAMAWLLKNDASVSVVDFSHATPLHHAAPVPCPGYKRLRDAVTTVVWLLQHQSDVSRMDINQQTPLHWASISSSSGVGQRMLAKLIEAGSNIAAADVLGNTPLHLVAAVGGGYRPVDMLVAAGATVSVVNSRGDTPVHTAVGYGTCDSWQLQRLLRHNNEGRQQLKLANKAGFAPLQLGAVVGWRLSTV